MSLSSVFFLVLGAVLILALLFVFFRILLFLLPVALIAFLILYLLVKYTNRGRDKNDYSLFHLKSAATAKSSGRKKARHVKVKDVKDH